MIVRVITPSLLEARVLQVVDLVLDGRKPEDQTVELKSKWIEPIHKMARLIAAHANAARGEDILWIIGVDDEGRKVTGADGKEISNWYNQIAAEFDGIAPELLLHRVCVHEQGPVVAMLFSTSAAPYLVRVRNKDEGGVQPRHEIPFRQGNSTRTATRIDLLRILGPRAHLPRFEILTCRMSVYTKRSRHDNNFELHVNTFVSTPDGARVVLPIHKCNIRLTWTVDDEESTIDRRFSGFRLWKGSTQSELLSLLVVEHAAYVQCAFEAQTTLVPDSRVPVHAHITLGFPDTAFTLKYDWVLQPSRASPDGRITWEWEPEEGDGM